MVMTTRYRLARRKWILGAAHAGLASISFPAFSTTRKTITDVSGRQVEIPRSPNRIILLEAQDILSMACVHPNPATLVVGWSGTDRIDSAYVRRTYTEKARKIADIGNQTSTSLSLEGVLSLKPDVIVASAYMAPGFEDNPFVQAMTNFNIPVVFSQISSNSRNKSGSNAQPASVDDVAISTMRFWGELLNQQAKAENFIAFDSLRRSHIRSRTRNLSPVKTYFEVMSTNTDCCWAAGSQTWGELLRAAGGRGLNASLGSSWYTKLSLEGLIAERPDVYIATGGDFSAASRPSIAPGTDKIKAAASLAQMMQRPGFAHLPAVAEKKVYGIWSGLISNIILQGLFMEVAAKWLHPDAFTDLEPASYLAELNRTFLSQPLAGPLWTALPPS
ncbi:ABC transporter substrate-binding protein [Advenella sp. FME57]|uniref:ABC transporter substrate-binding protein n=1 Tax=Advenella sp. FME57 TaxID=2742604 RepID=UPI00186695E8|nr:ABC transporter substrate-binding protein [Advenella sp. FME57]